MKPPRFHYARPETLDEVLALLHEHEDAKVLAGGQSLVPLLNFRLALPDVLVDLSRVAGLATISHEPDALVVGAMARQRALEVSTLAQQHCPLLGQALRQVAHVQVRNRGTIGGSIAHADPSAELPAAALALDATITAQSVRGTRTVAARDFFSGPFMTALEHDEVLTEVRFPSTDAAQTAFVELSRRSGDFPLVAVATVVVAGPEEVSHAAIAATGVTGEPIRLTETEATLVGKRLTDVTASEAAAAAASEVEPASDLHADAEYRRELTGVLVRRVLMGTRR